MQRGRLEHLRRAGAGGCRAFYASFHGARGRAFIANVSVSARDGNDRFGSGLHDFRRNCRALASLRLAVRRSGWYHPAMSEKKLKKPLKLKARLPRGLEDRGPAA